MRAPNRETAVYAALIVLAGALQISTGAYEAGLSGSVFDEPAHYTSGVMAYDYLRHAPFSNPVRFATDYYLHYPAVAIGHWPPMLYGVQALWYLPFGPSLTAALVLNGLLTAAAAFLVFRLGRRIVGFWPAAACAVAYLLIRDVTTLSAHVMAEPLMIVFALGALEALEQFRTSERWGALYAFSGLAAAAILTKAVAWSLAPLPTAAALLSRRWDWLRNERFWSAQALVVLLCAPWELAMRSMVAAGFVPPAQPLAARGLDVLGELVGTVGPVIAAAAVLGAAVGLRSDGRAAWKTLGAAALGCLGLVWLAPVPVDPRYTILAWPIAVLAAAYGLKAAAGKFLSDLRASQAAAAAIILAALAHGSLPRVYAKRPTAIETVAEDLLRRPELADRVWLVSSEAGGEVLFVGEVARREHPPSRYVLRASKLLARSSWQADGEYASLVDTESELASRLDEPPVSVVVLHESKPLREYRHHRLLRTLVRNRPEVWRPVAAYSDSEGEIHVYAADRQSTKPGTITLDMTLVLGKTLSGRAQPSPAAETKN